MNPWIPQTWINYFNPLGYTLFHSLWQSFIIYLFYIGIIKLYPKISVGLRYSLGLSTLSLVFISFLYNLVNEYHSGGYFTNPIANKSVSNSAMVLPLYSNPHSVGPSNFAGAREFDFFRLGFSIWGILYFLCLGFMLFRLATNLIPIYKLKQNKNLFIPHEKLIQLFNTLKSKIQFPSQAQLWLSSQVLSPITFGFFKPVILFPLGVCSKLSISQLEGLLIHEMAHIVRYDYIINIFQTLVETLLFFNPMVWILNKEIRFEREKCCDDLVSKYYSGGLIEYARTLLSLEEGRNLYLSISAYSKPNQLLKRIQRIMKNPIEDTSKSSYLSGFIALLTGLIFIGLLSSGKFANQDLKSNTTGFGLGSKMTWIHPDTNPRLKVFPNIELDKIQEQNEINEFWHWK